MYEVEVFLEELKKNYTIYDKQYGIIEVIEELIAKETPFKPIVEFENRNVKVGKCRCGNSTYNDGQRCHVCNQKIRW